MFNLYHFPMIIMMFCILVFVNVAIDAGVAVMAYQKKDANSKPIVVMALLAIIVAVGYLGTVLSQNLHVVEICNGLYFSAITAIILYLLKFIIVFAQWQEKKGARILRACVTILAVWDIAVEILNAIPGTFLYQRAISYTKNPALDFASYQWNQHALYQAHLATTYIMVTIALILLFIRLFQLPGGYRSQCSYTILSVILVIFVNALFLLLDKQEFTSVYHLDYSIIGYCVCCTIIFWATYEYTRQGMLKQFKFTILENIDQGIALFDYKNELVVQSEKMRLLFPAATIETGMPIKNFLDNCDVDPDCETAVDDYSFQCYVKRGSVIRPIRCDFKPLKNKKAEITGRMFVFTDSVFDTDLVTGFHNLDSYEIYLKEKNMDATNDVVVAIFDINGLGYINSAYGRNYGDQRISQLASAMRQCFPKTTYFVRGNEANLIAVCQRTSENQVREYLAEVAKEYKYNIQSAMATVEELNPSIINAIVVARRSLRTKKLLDKKSNHSALLNSLIQALQECDSDTEAHVRRTQDMGAMLGFRIGLSDAQQSDLSLLCLLHDIGKIGVPLDILNKPGKLTDHEWKAVQSHVEKGYQIANSSQELQGIADMILHHHERWDGNGYPDGLSRESIPILCRIISVVDAYDAMVNNRSYRAAMDKEAAIHELRKNAGSQFDPTIVTEFINMLVEKGEASKYPIVYREPEEQVEPADDRAALNAKHQVYPLSYSRYILSERMEILEVDDAFEEMTGYSREDLELLHLKQEDLIPEEDRTAYICLITEQLTKCHEAYFEHRINRKNGTTMTVFCFGRVYYDSSHREERSEIIITNTENTHFMQTLFTMEQNKAQKRLRRWEDKYRKDALTGLMSHEAFRNDVGEMLLSAEKKVMFMMLDVDKFKEYNDTHGHLAGDEFLIRIAQSLQSALRADDMASRMGGDEFAVAMFFDEMTKEELMINRAGQVLDSMNLSLEDVKGATTLSMGVVIGSKNPETFNQLYEKADKALYESKRKGRSCLTVYSDTMTQE